MTLLPFMCYSHVSMPGVFLLCVTSHETSSEFFWCISGFIFHVGIESRERDPCDNYVVLSVQVKNIFFNAVNCGPISLIT